MQRGGAMRIRGAVVVLLCCLSAPGFGQTLGLNAPELFDRAMNALIGSGAGRSDATALDYLHRSADLGYAPAQVVLGYFYETGRIVAQEPIQALDWYRKAAEQDDQLAEWLVGRIIYSGEEPPRDLNAAIFWLQKAANHNDPFGEYLLGKIRMERQDYVAAAYYLRKAAMQGLPQAQFQLGRLLEQGRGIPEDKFEAYTWLLLSSQAGNPAVAMDLQSLESDLGSTQVEQAKSRARELQAATARSVAARGCTGWPGEFKDIPVPPPPYLQRFCR